ncbi:hypothetical protein YSA_00672 [Pseudomonas putida ND6]|uniref:Uncharacterized protein n=1 Tax=Pseudomonas putida ND6 TaxID=231023 RepID=I3UNR8_PSEPU|nr:hypothetical protein YSA_00672 [Pseudomonas putida ND6]
MAPDSPFILFWHCHLCQQALPIAVNPGEYRKNKTVLKNKINKIK